MQKKRLWGNFWRVYFGLLREQAMTEMKIDQHETRLDEPPRKKYTPPKNYRTTLKILYISNLKICRRHIWGQIIYKHIFIYLFARTKTNMGIKTMVSSSSDKYAHIRISSFSFAKDLCRHLLLLSYIFDIMEVPQRLTLHLTHDEVVRALTLLEDGRSQRYVARVLGVNHSTIVRLAQWFHETGSVARRPGQGRRRVTS